jgi:hypothetical protein
VACAPGFLGGVGVVLGRLFLPTLLAGAGISLRQEDDRGVSRRLKERISYFLADDAATQQDLCYKVKACYRTRSEIVHGRWEDDPEFDERMYITEAIVRTVARNIADKAGVLQAFLSSVRDEFLETWVRSRSFSPPPFPTA